LLASKERQSPQNHIARRIRELCKLATEKPSKRGAPGVSRKESSRALSLFFLSLKLAFLAQEEAEAKESIILSFVFLFLKIQNETKHSSRRRETPRCSVVVVVHRRRQKRRESSERERKWTKRSSILNGLLR
jgi:hypothetical protein